MGVGRDLWVKRDDVSGVRYGGNKVRTLEALFGAARAAGARRIWAVGAVGSNHALATVLHARAAGLEPGVMLFPQPVTACARENLVATLAERPALRSLWSWAAVPFAVFAERVAGRLAELVAERFSERRGAGSYVMVPGGATPEGALGYVSAALEVAEQAAAGVAPLPRRVVVGAGSTCTSAGLLAGFVLAGRLGLLDVHAVPEIMAVRVTPWPVTSAFRIVSLAGRTAALVARLAGVPRLAAGGAELAARLTVLGGFIGRGYGHVTESGLRAAAAFAEAGGPPLDTCYSAKAAAALLAEEREGPTLFWATKSSRPLPPAPAPLPADLACPDADRAGPAAIPRAFSRWLERPIPALPWRSKHEIPVG